jgi:very-short-patch-repair endonuclease
MTSRSTLRRREIVRAAEPFGGALSRTMLRDLGVDRHAIAREVAADRWATHGAQTVATHPRELEAPALWWRALWETGIAMASLDGVSALLAAGMTGYDEPSVHVSIPRSRNRRRIDGVRVHRVQRVPGEVIRDRGPLRVAPSLAAIRAAHWASSDRQAALLLVLPIQQGIVSGPWLKAAGQAWSGRRRRALVPQLVQDITDGATSLGELDFARMCRERGLPEPDRQVVMRTPRGRVYLDVRWRGARLVVEIDGSHHQAGLTLVADQLRQNDVALRGEVFLRISLLGLRIAPDAFFDQIGRALRDAHAA